MMHSNASYKTKVVHHVITQTSTMTQSRPDANSYISEESAGFQERDLEAGDSIGMRV
jgi:hypothetical protein